jgi:uncharacterized protein YcbK (DUF882 family)
LHGIYRKFPQSGLFQELHAKAPNGDASPEMIREILLRDKNIPTNQKNASAFDDSTVQAEGNFPELDRWARDFEQAGVKNIQSDKNREYPMIDSMQRGKEAGYLKTILATRHLPPAEKELARAAQRNETAKNILGGAADILGGPDKATGAYRTERMRRLMSDSEKKGAEDALVALGIDKTADIMGAIGSGAGKIMQGAGKMMGFLPTGIGNAAGAVVGGVGGAMQGFFDNPHARWHGALAGGTAGAVGGALPLGAGIPAQIGLNMALAPKPPQMM